MTTRIMSNKISFGLDEAARYTVYLSLIFMAISAPLSNLFIIGIVLTLLAGNLKKKFEIAKAFKMNWIACLLILVFFIGMFYNPYGLKLAFHGFQKDIHRVLAPLFLIPLFLEKQHRDKAINCLVLGCLLAALLLAGKVPVHFAPIPLSVLFAYVSFVLLNRFTDAHNKWLRSAYVAGFLFLFFVLFFVNRERSGMLIFFVLLVLFGYQRVKIKGFVFASVAAVMVFSGVMLTSHQFRSRLHVGYKDVVAFHNNKVKNTNSWGMRLLLSKFALHHIAEKPLIGHGTGMYARGVDDAYDPTMRHGLETSENSYLDIALDVGVVGLIVFLTWLGFALFETKLLERPEKYLAQGLVVSMIVACGTVPAFNVNLSATMFVLGLVILFGAPSSASCFFARL